MNQKIVVAIVFFIAAILIMGTSIAASVNGQDANWALLVGGCCFIVAGAVWLVQGIRAKK